MGLVSALHADPAHDEELDPSMLRIEAGQYSAICLVEEHARDVTSFPCNDVRIGKGS